MKNTEGYKNAQTLDYQTDNQAFVLKKGKNTEQYIFHFTPLYFFDIAQVK
jgi:hypothetical protein